MQDYSQAIIDGYAEGKPKIKLVQLDFAQGTLYLTTAPFDHVWNSNNYLGNGLLLKLSESSAKTQLSSLSKNITFSAVSSTIRALVLGQSQVNREVIIHEVLLDGDDINGFTMIDQPILEWQGIISSIKISDDKKSPKVEISTTGVFDDFDRRVNRITTVASQQRHFPNDTGFRFASESNKEIKWGIE